MKRKAYAYRERWSRTLESETPVYFYVVRYGFWSSLFGCSESGMSTTTATAFRDYIFNKQEEGDRIITEGLPFFTRRRIRRKLRYDSGEVLRDESGRSVFAEIKRMPVD